MAGPGVNIKFEKELPALFQKNEETTMLNLGTCSLHPVHTAFENGLDELGFPYESFFNDINFFFQLSAGRREDYASLANITNVATEFAKKFGATR